MTTTASAKRRVRNENVTRFIARLERLKHAEDRASLALLRRSLVDYGRDFSAYTVLGDVLPEKSSEEDRVETYLLVAGLFAMHQNSCNDDTSFGGSLRLLGDELGDVGEKSLDLLVGALLNADREDLPVRLRHIVARLASGQKKPVPVDYGRLLDDLLRWESVSRTVQRRWAHDYWVVRDTSGTGTGASGGNDDDSRD